MTLAERFARVQLAQDLTLSNELEVFKALPFADQCQTAVAFGKAHLGKKFLDVWHQEPRWLQWVLKNYEDSKKVEHLKLFHFVQVMLEQEETGIMPKPVNKGSQAIPKAKAKGKSSHHMPETENHAETVHLCAGGRRGALGHHQQPSSPRRSDRSSAGKDASCGECTDRNPDPAASSLLDAREIDRSYHAAGDDNDECDDVLFTCTQQQKFKVQLQELIKRFETELLVTQHQNQKHGKPLHLVEVFCGPKSELTRQTLQLKGNAVRFGLDQGDLSSSDGRRKLFETIVIHKPKHIWLSPTCGPWCSWSVLNESKSMDMFQKIQSQREDHLYQIAIGIVLLRHQVTARRHLHWEQPRKSLMFRSPLLQELTNSTYAAEFDMCRLGELKDPVTQKLIQKSMTVQTTSKSMFEGLHGRHCTRNHEHQRLEGSVSLNNHQVRRTAYSENYPRKFARAVAKILVSVRTNTESPRGYQRWDHVFAAVDSKRKRTEADGNHRATKYLKPAAKLIAPNEMATKRRRLYQKSSEGSDSNHYQQLSQEIMQQVSQELPRVGRKEITNSNVKDKIQELLMTKLSIAL